MSDLARRPNPHQQRALARRENPGRPEGIVRLVLEAIRDVAYAGAQASDTEEGGVAADSIVDENCDGIVGLWNWHQALSMLRKGGWMLNDAIERAMIRDLRDEAIRLDDAIIRVDVEPPLRRIRDLDGLIAYLELSVGAMLCFRTSDLQVSGLRKYAEGRGDDPDEIVDRFIEWVGEEGPPDVKIHRMEYSPYWALHLKKGERMKQPPRENRRYE